MIAEVIINSNVKNLNRKFDYIIPEELEAQAIVGARVLLPFGNKKELEEGYIVGIKETSEYLDKLKSIAKIESKLHCCNGPGCLRPCRACRRRYRAYR